MALPAFQSTCEPAQELAQQLSKIIADNDLDKYPIILHIIGGEGAFIYTEIAPLLEKFISGVVIESLPSSKENVSSKISSNVIFNIDKYFLTSRIRGDNKKL